MNSLKNRTTRIGAMLTIAASCLVPLTYSLAEPLKKMSVSSAPHSGYSVESFFWGTPGRPMVVTHSGGGILSTYPPGVDLFTEPKLKSSLAVLVKLRNADEEVVGFASELEVFPPGPAADFTTRNQVIWDTVWTVTLPGRGSLFLYQKEGSDQGVTDTVIIPTLENGEIWNGDITFQTTVGPRPDGTGIIIGGTGEFADAKGYFVEIDRITMYTPDRRLVLKGELRVFRER